MSNRAQRRKTATLEASRLVGIRETVEFMFVVLAYELHRRGWKKQSILTLIKRIDYTFDSVTKGYTNLKDLRDVLAEELDLTL